MSVCPLPPCFFPLSFFDKHFLAAKSVLGLCSVKDTPLALEMRPAKPTSTNILRWAEGPG